jgi:hypothetical protein
LLPQGHRKLPLRQLLFPANKDVLGTLYSQADGVSSILFSYKAIDYLYSTGPGLCNEVNQWLRTQTGKSTLISRVSGKERNRFFNKQGQRIEDARGRLN